MNRPFKRMAGSICFGTVLVCLSAQPTSPQLPAGPGTGPGLPETIEAIDSARVTTRILYVTAHPDDESATLLTYLARGLHADVARDCDTRYAPPQICLRHISDRSRDADRQFPDKYNLST